MQKRAYIFAHRREGVDHDYKHGVVLYAVPIRHYWYHKTWRDKLWTVSTLAFFSWHSEPNIVNFQSPNRIWRGLRSCVHHCRRRWPRSGNEVIDGVWAVRRTCVIQAVHNIQFLLFWVLQQETTTPSAQIYRQWYSVPAFLRPPATTTPSTQKNYWDLKFRLNHMVLMWLDHEGVVISLEVAKSHALFVSRSWCACAILPLRRFQKTARRKITFEHSSAILYEPTATRCFR